MNGLNNLKVLLILIASIQCQDLNDFNPFESGSGSDPNQLQLDNFAHDALRSLNNTNTQGAQTTTTEATTTKISPQRIAGPNSFFRASKNAKMISDIFNIGLNFTKNKAKERANAGKKPISFLSGVRLSTKFCPFNQTISCDSSIKYQSFDGSCNNLLFPWYGKTETPYKRLLAPEYGDGFDSPRTLSVSNKSLPNPRLISRTIMNDNGAISKIWTNIFTHFGQFLTHDITALSLSAGINYILFFLKQIYFYLKMALVFFWSKFNYNVENVNI